MSLDTKKNGVISKEDLINGYMIIYKDTEKAKKVAERVMRRINMNQNGAIDYNDINY